MCSVSTEANSKTNIEKLFHSSGTCVYRVEDLRVNASVRQFQLRSAPSRWATAGYFPAFSVQGVEHLPILRCPGAGHLPILGLFPSFWHPRGFLSEYNNYKEDITGKKADWLICQGQEVVKACSQFYACITSLLIKPELHSESYRHESTFFG